MKKWQPISSHTVVFIWNQINICIQKRERLKEERQMCKIIEQHPNNFNVAESQSSLEILKEE